MAILRQEPQALQRRPRNEPVPLHTDERSVYVVPYDERDEQPGHVSPVELFATLAEAEAARDDHSERNGIATGLAIGLSVVAVVGLGVMLCYVLFRKRDQPQLNGSMPQMFPQPVPMPYPYPVPQLGAPGLPSSSTDDPARAILEQVKQRRSIEQDMRTLMRSYLLPNINTPGTLPIRIARAGDVPYDVSIRVVSPANAQAIIATDPNELNVIGIPIGNTLILATGERQVVRISPRQSLYAKGTLNSTVISVNGTNSEIDVIV